MNRSRLAASALAVMVVFTSSIASAQLFRSRTSYRSCYQNGVQAPQQRSYSSPQRSSSSSTPRWKLQKTDPAKYRTS
ncbi:hypothetical protein Pan44_22800 [Caulifigura coniformis]|uniref:Secreted protein n=1 Tax=Caulifigura coniformis TaxID=2527983 RepID=A0A517SDP5_9PLAN|nr:hypothetical protein [Caulifigura coniformis]QDT54252.1 hypothetical protein Pan44_22800 [Caulifigura coniformis]